MLVILSLAYSWLLDETHVSLVKQEKGLTELKVEFMYFIKYRQFFIEQYKYKIKKLESMLLVFLPIILYLRPISSLLLTIFCNSGCEEVGIMGYVYTWSPSSNSYGRNSNWSSMGNLWCIQSFCGAESSYNLCLLCSSSDILIGLSKVFKFN